MYFYKHHRESKGFQLGANLNVNLDSAWSSYSGVSA